MPAITYRLGGKRESEIGAPSRSSPETEIVLLVPSNYVSQRRPRLSTKRPFDIWVDESTMLYPLIAALAILSVERTATARIPVAKGGGRLMRELPSWPKGRTRNLGQLPFLIC